VKRITSDGFSLPHGREQPRNLRFGTSRVWVGKEQAKEKAKERAMGQQVQPWRSGAGERLWLSMLVDTMEKVACREFRAVPCDRLVLAQVSAQLARPASPYPHGASRFSLRN
jgi:hypothetical protein